MSWFKFNPGELIQELKEKLAYKEGKLFATEVIINKHSKVPSWMINDYIKLCGEISELKQKIKYIEGK